MNNTTNNNENANNGEYNFQSPLTGKKFDPAKVLDDIQHEIKALQRDAGDLTSDHRDINDLSGEIKHCLANLEMLLDGLSYLSNETIMGDYFSDYKMLAIAKSFYRLKDVIQIREREHEFIWNMAFHGEEDPHSMNN